MLFDPDAHEPLTERPWSEARARDAIRAIAEDAEAAFDPDTLWPPHPRDLEGGPLPAVASLYLGAGGVIWALDELARAGVVELRRDWAPVAAGLPGRYLAAPDFPEDTGAGRCRRCGWGRRASCSSRTAWRRSARSRTGCSSASAPTSPTRPGS